MAIFPTLPGINVPLDKGAEKQAKLEGTTALKKSMLMARSGVPEKVATVDPWDEFNTRLHQAQQEQLDADVRNKNALVNDNDLNTAWGSILNWGTSFLPGATRLVGDVASYPLTAYGETQRSQVPDEHMALYQQEQDYKAQVEGLKSAEANLGIDVALGKLDPIQAAARRLELKNQAAALKAPDPEQLKVLDQPGTYQSNGSFGFAGDVHPQGPAPSSRERIESAKAALNFSKKVDSAIESVTQGLVNDTKRRMLDADMTESVQANKQSFVAAEDAWDKGDTGTALLEAGKGVAGLVKDFGGDALDNPAAVAEYISENTPQLAIGAFGKAGQALLAGTNLAYGMDIYRKGLEGYQAQHDGKMPTQAEAQEMLGWSLSAAAAEQVGDVLTLAPLKGVTGKVLGDAVSELRVAKAAQALGRVPAAAAEGVVSESVTEGYQTAVEDSLSKLDGNLNWENIAKAAGIGGMVGGGLKGGVETVAQVAEGALPDLPEMNLDPTATAKAREAAFTSAKETGDIAPLLDAQAPTYDPGTAVSALEQYAGREDVDAEEVFSRAEQLVSNKEAVQSKLQDLLEANSEEGRAKIQAQVEDLDNQIQASEDPELTASLEAEKAQVSARLLDDTQVEQLQQMYTNGQDTLGTMQVALQGWKQKRDEAEVGSSTLELANTPVAELDEQQASDAALAVNKTMTLAMRNSPHLPVERMEELANNSENSLQPEQRDYLLKAAEARRAVTAAKDLDQVSREVLDGGNGNLGLANYERQFADAVQQNDRAGVQASLGGLLNFAKVHRAKLQTFTEAFDKSAETGQSYRLLPEGNGQWVPADRSLTGAEFKARGGILISAQRSGKLLTALDAEVKALETGALAMRAALKALPRKTKVAKPAPVQVPAAEKAPAQTASVARSEPQASPQANTEPASTGDFEAEVAQFEADLKAHAEKVEQANSEAEQQRRTTAFLADKTPPAQAEQSDYVGSEEGTLLLTPRLGLVQAGDRETTTTPRPLVAVRDFVSRVRDGSVSLDSFVSQPISEAQSPLLAHFFGVYDQWAAGLTSVLRRPMGRNKETGEVEVADGQFDRDPIQHFMDDNLEMEENTVTALLAAAFAWLSEEVNSPLYRTAKEVKAMLGKSEDEAFGHHDTYNRLKEMLGRRTVLEARLGQFAVQALGLKAKDEHTAQNILPQLQANLGAHLFDMLNQLDLIHIVEVDLSEENASNEDPEGLRTQFTQDNFIQLNRDDSKALSEPLEALKSVSRGTGGVLGNLFGMESAAQFPLLRAPKVTQESTNSGKQKVTSSVATALKKIAKREYQFRPVMQLLQGASQGFLEDLAGIQKIENQVMHKELRDSAQAANDNLKRELEQIQDLWSYLKGQGNPFTSFFALPDQWKNSRIGYKNLWANMQTSKIARFLVSPKGWETEVRLDNLDGFKLRVLEGLDQKTDSTPDSVTLQQWDKVTGQAHIQAAVQALRTALADNALTPEIEATVTNAVRKTGTNLHAFEALLALAQYEEAKAVPGTESFKTLLTTEIDGKTNGPMLSLWLLGVMSEGFAQMGGFFTQASGVKSFGHWKPGNHDLYQFVASKLLKNLQAMNLPKEVLSSVHRLVGNPLEDDGSITSAGRNLVKNPLTTLIYGSGMSTTVGKMTDVFIEKVYETVAAIHEGKSYGPKALKLTGEAAWAQFQQDLMTLSGEQEPLFPETVEQGLETAISATQLKLLRQGYMDSIGVAVSSTIETELGAYMTARKQMVRQANLTWNLYDQARSKLLSQLKEHLMKTGAMAYTEHKGQKVPLRDLTPAEEQQALAVLKDLEPRMHTALSQRDNELDAGIYVAKEERSTNREFAYTSNVQGVATENGQRRNTTHTAMPITYGERNPGVSVMANGVQSVDGNIIVEVIANLNAVGVHDALLVNLQDALEAGQQLNQQTLDMLLSYSLPRQSLEALGRTLSGYMQYLQQNPEDFDAPALRKLLSSQRESKEDVVTFKALVERATRFAYRSDRVRLNGLAQMGVIDQYTLEAGVFNVPESFRNQARKMLKELSPVVDPTLLGLAEQLDGMLKEQARAPKAKAQPAQPVQLTLDEALRSKEDLTTRDVIRFLREQIGQPAEGDSMGKLYQQILALGAKTLGDLPVKYIGPEQVSEIPEDAGNAYGWYHVAADGQAHIGIRGSELPGSQITPELIVHEVLHALVSSLIQQAEQGTATAEVQAAVTELKAIQEAVRQSLQHDGEVRELYAEALGNVQEFVTWGMTNPGFQHLLKGVAYTNPKQPSLKNLAQRFFAGIAEVVFGKRAPAMTNSLSHLFARVSVLLAESVQARPDTQSGEVTFAMAAPKGPLELNPTALFEGLAGQPNGYTDPAFAKTVQELMGSVVEAVGGPFQQFYQQAAQGAKSALDVLLNAQTQGLLPTGNGLRSSGFQLGDQQAYAIEMLTETLHSTLRDTSLEAEKQLSTLFKEASQQVTPSDLGGQAQWDALFSAQAIDTDGLYLARFAAMALAWPPLANKMGFTTQAVSAQSTSLYGKVLDFLEKVLNYLAQASHKAYAGQQADEKLNVLVKRLVALEGKYQLRQQRAQEPTFVDTLEDWFDGVSEKGREALAKFGRKAIFTRSKSPGMRLLGGIATAVAEDRVGQITDAAEQLYHRSVQGQMGFLASLANEMRGTKGSNLWSRVMITVSKVREKTRQDINRDIAKLVRESYANKGKDLTRDQKKDLTNVLLRSGASVLLDQGFSLAQIETLLRDPAVLEQHIQAAQGQLTGRYQHYWHKQANALGYMLATGRDRGDNTMLNVENIARLSNTYYESLITEAEVQQALPWIDQLATLRALRYMSQVRKDSVANLMASEARRTDGGNGVLASLLLHKSLLSKAKDRVFQGSERLMRKGYVPEIHNPHLEVTAVPVADQARYEAEGWKFESLLPGDKGDVTWEPRVLMSIEKVTPRYLTGNLSLTSMKAQGSTVHSGLELFDFSGRNDYNYAVNRAIEARRGMKIMQMFRPGPIEDLSKNDEVRMTPVTNGDGRVVNYRYMMSHENRDVLLERTNEMDLVLGELASNTFDKETTVSHNDKVIKGLREQWQLEQASIPEAYVLFGPDSKDPVLQGQYRLLPRETRNTIEALWGGPNMMLRRDTLDLHLGYRKYSLAESMSKDSKDRGWWEKLFVFLAQDLFKIGPKGVQRVLKAENLVMALNQEIKDFFVVKSGTTTYWNIVSNLSLLKLYGVGVAEIVRSHRVALKGARDWQKHDSELRRLVAMRDSGYVIGSTADLDQQIAILEDLQARSPVREVMAMGMMPTLVEDMDNADDPYSYKSYAAKKAEKYLNYVPNFVKQGAKWVYMTHDTPVYQFLSQGAQLSDFVARYTLYEHLKTRRKNPLTPAEAAQASIDAFINYDHLSHRYLQYLNDVGLVRFTKYYMRIQAVLMHLYQQNPARALILGMVENYFSGMQTVMDSAWWGRLGLPLEGSALDYPQAISEGVVSKALGKLF